MPVAEQQQKPQAAAKATLSAAEIRFWAKVNKSSGVFKIVRGELSECWLWTGAISGNGYGNFWADGKYIAAHCFSFNLANGPIEKPLERDHLCRTRPCVRPEHLEAVTHDINMARGINSRYNSKKTACLRGHPLDMIAKDGKRYCSVCRTEACRLGQQRYYKRLREKYGVSSTADAVRANAAARKSGAQ